MRRRNITREILDALPAQVVLLDSSGRIEIVNEAWRKFATENGLRTEHFALGSNYLKVCDTSQAEGAEGATIMSSGIRAVLRGELPLFELVYSCHSPIKKFRFKVIVTPVKLAKH
ncbi:MAG: domain S-box/diguanylate cyclase protein, partial [Herminiimonas sp.]|nr:domain S-box/diguanylate cyclase protein [Herminiimonas sp.]